MGFERQTEAAANLVKIPSEALDEVLSHTMYKLSGFSKVNSPEKSSAYHLLFLVIKLS